MTELVVPRISFVVPIRNGEGLVPHIVSCCQADLRSGHCRLIFVDDASEDGTSPALERACAEMPGVEVLRNDARIGPGPSRNHGLACVRTPYVAFIDADDKFNAQAYIRLALVMQEESASVGFLNFTVNEQPQPDGWLPSGWTQGSLEPIANWAAPWRFIFNTDTARSHVHFPNLEYGEDLIALIDALPKLGKAIKSPEIGYDYRMDPASTSLSTQVSLTSLLDVLAALESRYPSLAGQDQQIVGSWRIRIVSRLSLSLAKDVLRISQTKRESPRAARKVAFSSLVREYAGCLTLRPGTWITVWRRRRQTRGTPKTRYLTSAR